MEKAWCWMGANGEAKCKDYSWEERAFAEDAAGMLGGCVWPPRSYSCNFCRREFRSAQALGGHMNVHRRDRARLKQMSAHNNQDPKLDHPQNPAVKSPLSFGDKRFTPNQRVINHPSPMFVPQTSVVSIHQTIYTPESKFVSSLVVNNDRNLTFLSLRNDDDDTSNCKQVPLKNTKQLMRSSSTNTVVDNQDVHNNNIRKKRKLDTCASTTMPMFINKGQDLEPKLDIPNKEDIDLELRLGDRPKKHGIEFLNSSSLDQE